MLQVWGKVKATHDLQGTYRTGLQESLSIQTYKRIHDGEEKRMKKNCPRCIKGNMLFEVKNKYGQEVWICVNCGHTEIMPATKGIKAAI